MIKSLLPVAVSLVALIATLDRPGYDDTPQIPGQEWRVHDKARPHPATVTPGEGSAPPSDAIVIFDGTSLDGFVSDDGSAAKWNLVDGAMEVNGSGSIRTRREFGDMQLHLEFATPSEVVSESQGRGNSGVFLMGRYEVQILDSFANETYADGQCAAIYGQQPPLVNAARAPGQWQSYDIVWIAPRFDAGGALTSPARLTVFHNGVLVHHAQPLTGPVAHRDVRAYEAHPPRLPFGLQDHGNPTRFRNVWVREL